MTATGAPVPDDRLRIGFACHWTEPRETSWSGTPWNLRAALGRVAEVTDVEVGLSAPERQAVRLASVRRTPAGWTSPWRHARYTRAAVAGRVRRAGARSGVDLLLQVQDLGVTRVPFAVLQDLSYALLLDLYGPGGVPHFRTFGRRRIEALRRRQDQVYDRAAMLLPMSGWLGDSLVAHGVGRERVTVVNPGANVPVPVGTPVPQRRTGAVWRLLFIGRDFDTKAGPQVVAAFEHLRAHWDTPVTLTVAGPAAWPLRSAPPEGVEFLGPVPFGRVGELMDSHDLFVMPSLMEGFGIVFVEALVRGLPCIARDACAMPEILGDDGGRLVRSQDPVDLADEIVRALQDDDLYEACARAADRRRRHYTWDRAADQVVDVAHRVLAGRG
ncbi:MAG: glycosyltransferase family 4 protein [Cellulomonas sp.]|nr:glycosyltransferase family 4 protein [Cellulomonas sp.]